MHAARAGRALLCSRSATVRLLDRDWRLSACFSLGWNSGSTLDHEWRRFTFECTSDEDSEDKKTRRYQNTLQPVRIPKTRKTLIAESPAGPHTPAQAHDLLAAV